LKRIPLLTLISIVSMLVSMAVQVVTAVRLGAGLERDALFVAMSVPLFLNTLLVSTVGVVITPAVLSHVSVALQRRMVIKVLTGLTLATLLLAAAIFALDTHFVHLLAPGFDGRRHALTVELLGYAVVMLPVQAASCVLGGYLVAQERILVPNIALGLGNSFVFGGILAMGESLTSAGVVLATLGGSGLALIIQAQALARWRPAAEEFPATSSASGVAASSFYRQALPLVFSGLVSRSMPLVERNLASSMGVGTISCLGYAGYLVYFLVNATTAPTATAYFARMCQLWNQGQRKEVGRILERNLLMVISIALAGGGMFILTAAELFEALPRVGRLSALDVTEFVTYSQILMVAFLFLACGGLLSRLFYVAGASIRMAYLDCLATGCYVVTAYLLAQHYGGRGLALAVSLHAVIVTMLFVVWARRQLEDALRRTFLLRVLGVAVRWGLVFSVAMAAKLLSPAVMPQKTSILFVGSAYLAGITWVLCYSGLFSRVLPSRDRRNKLP
jgi:putative peptidoglycan lipid II flippase